MTDQLDDLRETFHRDDQETKRTIGEYLYSNPGRWVPKQEIVDHVAIDESGVGRHLDDLHTEGYVQSKYDDEDHRYVRWNGRGAGGLAYWVRRVVPAELRTIGEDVRAFLTPDVLGGAYVPTAAFVGMLSIGLLTAMFTVVLTYLPLREVFGMTVLDAILITGISTVMASVLLALIPVARLLDRAIAAIWNL